MFSSFVAGVYLRESIACLIVYVFFAISPLASVSNSADGLLLLNQLLNEEE